MLQWRLHGACGETPARDALLDGGTRRGERVLSRPSVTLMTSDHLTSAQMAVSGSRPGYFERHRLGFGMSVRTRRAHVGPWLVSCLAMCWPPASLLHIVVRWRLRD